MLLALLACAGCTPKSSCGFRGRAEAQTATQVPPIMRCSLERESQAHRTPRPGSPRPDRLLMTSAFDPASDRTSCLGSIDLDRYPRLGGLPGCPCSGRPAALAPSLTNNTRAMDFESEEEEN